MKKYVFVTPERLAYQPNVPQADSPVPEFVDMQLIGFGYGGSMEDALKDLLELNGDLAEEKIKETFSLDLENDHRRFFDLKDYKNKYPLAS